MTTPYDTTGDPAQQFLHALRSPFPGDIPQGHPPLMNILFDLLHTLRFH